MTGHEFQVVLGLVLDPLPPSIADGPAMLAAQTRDSITLRHPGCFSTFLQLCEHHLPSAHKNADPCA